MNLGINLAAYQNFGNNEVFMDNANTSQEQLNDLVKALEAGEVTGRDVTDSSTSSGAPLKMESLDKTLKLLTYRESDIVLWKKIPKLQAFNTVEEYNQLTSYGADRGGFILEGELPLEEDSTYVRRAQLVKFMGVTKSVTHPMTLVNTMVGDIIARESKNGALYILRKLDKALTQSNSRIIPEEFNSLYAQHQEFDAYANLDAYFNAETVVDLRGDYLKEQYIERAAEGIIENFGLGTELFAPPKVLSDFVQGFYGNKFIQPNTEMTANGIMGQRVNQFDSQFGRIGLNWDIFMNKLPTKKSTDGATSPNAPAGIVPDGSTPIAAVGSDASSKWASADAGAYFYAVTALNRYGESAPVILSGSATTVVSGGAIDIKFAAGSGPNAATGYRIYRSNKGAANSTTAATYYPLFEISTADLTAGYDGASAGLCRDRDRIMPNTYQAFLVQMDEEVLAFRQLAPLMKMDLAMISTAYRFMVLLYGTPLLFAPKKMTRLVNIGIK